MPYPWFDFVSPELLANSRGGKLNSVRDCVAARIGNLKTKVNVVHKVKEWWGRRGVVEVKRDLNTRKVDLFA